MSTTILATKLQRPMFESPVVNRCRLVELLEAGAGRKLTLVSAPAGFGKTTLVCAWLAAASHRVAWLSLDEGDSDPIRFLDYLGAALRTITPGLDAGLGGAAASPKALPADEYLTRLLNEVASASLDAILVLDGYHLMDSAPVNAAVAFLLKNLPARLRIVICTRREPHLPLAQLRACGQLTELRSTDLRFRPSEAAEFLSCVMGIELPADALALLVARTEGWIVGVRLTAMALRDPRDAVGIAKSINGVHRFVQDYLVDEVLQNQPVRVQSFLMSTSILGRLCGPLCDAVLQDDTCAGEDMLDALDRANLFINPLDDERGWYRYDRLFADVLRRHSSRGRGESLGGDRRNACDLHERARRWYEAHGYGVEALHHTAASVDARIARGGSGFIGGGRASVPYRGDPLTHRETQVLRLVAEGLTNIEVSERMSLSLDTVKGHNRHLFEKLGVRSRTQAVVRAQALGLV